MNGEESYLNILRNIYENGVEKTPTRGGEVVNSTIMLPCQVFQHNMREGFPALTTRRVAFKSSMVELEGFLNGIADKAWYAERSCNFWRDWCAPYKIKSRMEAEGLSEIDSGTRLAWQKEENDLGKFYAYQMRSFNGDTILGDQIKTLVSNIKKNPYDRRLLVSYWNPLQIHEAALPCCHYSFQIITYQDKMDLLWNQRSCDVPIGLPHNITYYAMLLILLSKEANMTPNNLFGVMGDAHIYKNQLPGVEEQLRRTPTQLPTVKFSDNYLSSPDIFNWTHKDVSLLEYNPQSKIDFALTV